MRRTSLIVFPYIGDGHGGTASAHFALQFRPSIAGNTPPEIVSSSIEPVVEDTPANGAIVARDAEGDALTYAIKSGFGPSKGTVALRSDGTFTYTPNADVNGADHFTLTVTDGESAPVERVFDVNIASVNDVPVVASANIANVFEDQPAAGSIIARDVDGDTLSYAIKSGNGPHLGRVDFNPDGTFVYTPNANANGAESFIAVVDDGHGGKTEQSFSFNVAPVNDAPTAAADSGFSVQAGKTVRITAAELLRNDTDIDGDAVAITGVSSAMQGSVTRDGNGDILFTANGQSVGTASFDYQISDGHGGTASARVSVNVTAPSTNKPPIVLAVVPPLVIEDNPGLGAIIAFDPNGDALSYGLKANAGPLKGTVVFNSNGTFIYTPNANANGADHFTLTVTDGRSAAVERSVDVCIIPVNDAPIAHDDGGFSVVKGQTLRIAASQLLANDIDVDGDPLSIVSVSTCAGGTLSRAANGDILFKASSTFTGTASFTYNTSDGHGGYDTGAVLIAVTAPPHLINGTSGRDRLNGTVADDVFKGLGGSDTFVFKPGGGHDEITDFQVASGSNKDVLDLKAFHLASYAALLEHVVQDGHDTVIAPDHATTIRLDGVNHNLLTASHFLLV